MDPLMAPNSKAARDEKKEEPVRYDRKIEATPVVPRQNKLKQSFLEFILPDDTPDLRTYVENQTKKILKTVIFPKIRDLVLDSVSTMLGGGTVAQAARTSSGIPRVSYDSFSKQGTQQKNVQDTRRRLNTIYEDIAYYDINDTQRLKVLLEDAFYQYGRVTVLQLYDFAGKRAEMTPEQSHYGWTTIAGAHIEDGYDDNGNRIYILKMPFPVPLNY